MDIEKIQKSGPVTYSQDRIVFVLSAICFFLLLFLAYWAAGGFNWWLLITIPIVMYTLFIFLILSSTRVRFELNGYLDIDEIYCESGEEKLAYILYKPQCQPQDQIDQEKIGFINTN